MFELFEYVRTDGSCPFAEWLAGLNKEAAAKVAVALERMETGNLGDHKSVGQGVSERRIHFGPGYRIYFGRDGNTLIVLVGGGTKSRQAADIRNAQQTWAEYKATKRKKG
ncbi:MAG: type II toxin-antitoxin system RelE/ParE family toxin [Pirellulales bacterium]|nr:type II toxin-antitoxin system RelE/ParE family toxin [Pirellulales bacterium]